jgi:arginyl-tRNA--protein-N-Asp/Glu arginylyltransferase
VCADEEGDMDVRDRGMLYYRLLKHDVKEAQKVVCGQAKTVAEENTVIRRVGNCMYRVLCACTCTCMMARNMVPATSLFLMIKISGLIF